MFHICGLIQLEDDNMDEASEEMAVQLAAQGVIGKRVDEMESGFMMALDYMIQSAQNDQDDKVSCFDYIYSNYLPVQCSNVLHFFD